MNRQPRLLLIDVKNPALAQPHPPLNLLMLSEYLITHKALPEKNIRITNTVYENPIRIASVFRPDIIGFTVLTASYPYAVNLARQLRKQSDALFIIGGYHISGVPQSLEKPFDVGIIGEGEGPLLDIVRLVSNRNPPNMRRISRLPNIITRTGANKLSVNGMRPLLKPDDIPRVRWSMIRDEEIFSYTVIRQGKKSVVGKSVNIFTARGCPYRCKFCAAQSVWPNRMGFRTFPISRVGEDIELLRNKLGIDSVHIWDDTFAVSKQRLRDLIGELKKRDLLGKVTFNSIYVRGNLIDAEFAGLLKEFGTVSVHLGIESGSRNILGYLKNNSLTVEGIKKAISLLSAQDIDIYGSIMLFSPDETEADLDKSYELARWLERQKRFMALTILVTTPLPGTEIWERAVSMGIIDMHNVRWEDYVIINKSNREHGRIFFDNGFTPPAIDAQWSRFRKTADAIGQRKKGIRGWKSAKQSIDELNNGRITRILRHSSRVEMTIRMQRFLRNPVSSAARFIKHRVFPGDPS